MAPPAKHPHESNLVCAGCDSDRSKRANVSFHCPACARSLLYPLRIQQARTLIEREALGRQIEVISPDAAAPLSPTSPPRKRSSQPQDATASGPFIIDKHGCADHLAVEELRAETVRVDQRVDDITAHVEALRRELKAGRQDMLARRRAMERRREETAKAKRALAELRQKELGAVRAGTKRVGRVAEEQKHEIHAAREFLSREAAGLAGLKLRRRRGKDGVIRDDIVLSGVRIFDLRDLNAAPHAQVSAAFNNVAQLLVRVSHYLAVRLPCEITLPHRNFPLPTVLGLSTSYLNREIPFPGTPSHSGSTSPEASKAFDVRGLGHHPHYVGPPPRPRILALDRPLPDLARDDPGAYRYFVEAVTLLAWDVAWLCQSQGAGPFRSWEEMCPLGRNLWQLLVRNADKPSTNGPSSATRRFPFPSETYQAQLASQSQRLGQLSHGTALAFLGAALDPTTLQPQLDPFRGWRLTTPTRGIDRLRQHLLLEMQGAEWELLDDKDVAVAKEEMRRDEEEHLLLQQADAQRAREAAVAGGENGTTTKGRDSVSRTAATATGAKAAGAHVTNAAAAVVPTTSGDRDGKAHAASGWMKVRGRNADGVSERKGR